MRAIRAPAGDLLAATDQELDDRARRHRLHGVCAPWPSASSTPRPVARVGTEPKKAQTRPAMTSTVADSAITRMAGGMRLMR